MTPARCALGAALLLTCVAEKPAFAQEDPVQHMISRFHELNAIPADAQPSPFAVSAARMLADVQALEHMPRFTAQGRVEAAEYIQGQLEGMGLTVRLQAFPDEDPVGVNLLADFPGQDPSAGVVVVGAHFDAWSDSPGADDNASGVAAVLEIARTMTENELVSARTVQFAFFDLEEVGCVGSEAYVKQVDPATVHVALILEAMGLTCSAPGCQAFPGGLPTPPPARGDFLAVLVDMEHDQLAEPFRDTSSGLPLYLLSVPRKGLDASTTRRSDHSKFWDRGIAAMMVTDTGALRNPNYHLFGDKSDLLDLAFFGAATKAALDATLVLANR